MVIDSRTRALRALAQNCRFGAIIVPANCPMSTASHCCAKNADLLAKLQVVVTTADSSVRPIDINKLLEFDWSA